MADGYDVFAEQAALQRRQQLLQALQQQAQQQPITGRYGLAQALAKLGQAYLLKGADDDLKGRQATANREYQGQLQGQMQQFLDAYNGQEGVRRFGATPEAPSRDDGAPRAAIASAMTSQFPEMRQMGQTFLPGLVKQQVNPLDYLKLTGYDPQSRVAAAAGGGMQALKPEVEFMNVDGRVVDKRNPTRIGADFREEFSKPFQQGGDWYQRDSRGKVYKLDNAPKVNVGVSPIIAGPKAGVEEWAKLAGKTVSDLNEKARNSVAMMGQLNQLEALTKNGTINGPLAQPGIWLGQLFASTGYQPKPEEMAKLSNSQQFGNIAAELWLKTMNEVGGARGLVKEESDRIARNLPSLMQTPEGRLQIINFTKAVAQQNVADAQRASREYAAALQSGDLQQFTFGLSQAQLPRTEPMPAQGASGNVMTLDEYIKSRSGSK